VVNILDMTLFVHLAEDRLINVSITFILNTCMCTPYIAFLVLLTTGPYRWITKHSNNSKTGFGVRTMNITHAHINVPELFGKGNFYSISK
jgi:hypothetical protein